jgi:hypothetical protein
MSTTHNEAARLKALLLDNPNIPNDTEVNVEVWMEDDHPPLLDRQFTVGETFQWNEEKQYWIRESFWNHASSWAFILRSQKSGDGSRYTHTGTMYYVPKLLRLPSSRT